jgi:HlyD family secretion protein
VSAITSKRVGRSVHVPIDIEGYRRRREDQLREIAQRVASRVRASGQAVTLEPILAYERRIVHLSVQGQPGLKTESVGMEPNRRVVISSTAPGARGPFGGDGGPGGPGGFRGGPGGGFRGPGGGGGPGGGQRGGMGRIAEQLDLDAKQRKLWEQIQAEQAPKRQAAFASSGGDRRAAMETMRKITEEGFAKLTPALRPDQRTKLTALRATMAQGGGRRGGMRGGVVYVLREEKPTPVPVQVGATDGNSTEIVGAFKPGDQVIIGGGPRAKVQVRGPLGAGGGGGPGGGGGGQVRVRM